MINKLNFRTEEVILSNLDDKFILKKRSNSNLIPIIMFGVFSLFILNSIYLFLNNENSIASFIILIIGILSFRSFLWNLRGYEVIEIDEKNLYIKKTGSFLYPNSKYEKLKIKDLKYITESFADNSIINFKINELISMYTDIIGMKSGDILFKYDNLPVTFFKNLSHIEKEKVITEIKMRLEK
jgi:hypothetical protein